MDQSSSRVPRVEFPLWIQIGFLELGTLEWTAPGMSNPQVEKYHAATRGGPAGDHVPWCSSWLCWVMERAGYRSPKSKRAADWATWGYPVDMRLGAVAVFPGHVALVLGGLRKELWVIGGNQSDAVTIATMKWTPQVVFRSPVQVAA